MTDGTFTITLGQTQVNLGFLWHFFTSTLKKYKDSEFQNSEYLYIYFRIQIANQKTLKICYKIDFPKVWPSLDTSCIVSTFKSPYFENLSTYFWPQMTEQNCF